LIPLLLSFFTRFNIYYIILLCFFTKGMTSSTSKMDRYTTTEYGKQNMFASEPPMQYVEDYQGYGPHAEQLNGRLAMIGFFALVHNYILFGAVIPGIF